jgi:peptidoglycan/xylan/chitin deacetylase (PgdA/CDA1 family)
MQPSVPVLLYHHINEEEVPPELFEEQLKFLKKENYVSIGLEELTLYMKEGKKDWQKAVCITFDDGYLDNWVYAYPLLRKYNFKALLFLATWMVEEETTCSFNLQDVWQGKIAKDRLIPCVSTWSMLDGYPVKTDRRLCWEEVRQMNKSIFDVQSHTKRHRKVYADDKIKGFNQPRRKNSIWEIIDGDERYGTINFLRKPELANNRFIVDKELNDELAEYVLNNGYANFFKQDRWKEKLEDIVEDYRKKQGKIGRMETDEERYKRIKNVLLIGKGEIEGEIMKRCSAFSWPWGAYDNLSVKAAQNVGFKYLFTTKPGSNSPGDNMLFIKRFNAWKKDLNWFKSRIRLYSNKLRARIYGNMYRKI